MLYPMAYLGGDFGKHSCVQAGNDLTGYVEMAPRVVTIKTILKTDFAKFVLANSITLTPGTITMLIRGDVIHVHVMSQFLEDDLLEGAIEKEVAEIFEPEVLKSA